MNDSSDLSSDSSQKRFRERGIAWNGDNGLKALKVMTYFLRTSTSCRPKLCASNPKSSFETFSTSRPFYDRSPLLIFLSGQL